jgi:hypothetical protein
MITGAHSIIYSKDPKADREFFKNILKFPYVDIGKGWLIFGLPPSEIAIHPAAENSLQEFYLICDDIQVFLKQMSDSKTPCTEIADLPWGLLTYITLPGGGRLGVYEAKHAKPV